MMLVESGKVRLDDPVGLHVDSILSHLMNETVQTLFKPYGGQVTIRNLIAMRSGIPDFDLPHYDHQILDANRQSPMDILRYASTLAWACPPASCTSYSSTNYVLLGFVLLKHTPGPRQQGKEPPSGNEWTSLNLGKSLHLDFDEIIFPNKGRLSTVSGGLTVAGESLSNGKIELFEQDASILGWTCGNGVASGHATARFYYELLGPGGDLLSPESISVMKTWTKVDIGWEKDKLMYGGGLMIQSVSPKVKSPATLEEFASYVGHGGDTYGFMSDNGFFPSLNASISVIVNQDYDWAYPTQVVTCKVVELVARHLGHEDVDLGCIAPKSPSEKHYLCQNLYGKPTCIGSTFAGKGIGTNKEKCNSNCTAQNAGPLSPLKKPAGE